jgi:hypothetical protein
MSCYGLDALLVGFDLLTLLLFDSPGILNQYLTETNSVPPSTVSIPPNLAASKVVLDLMRYERTIKNAIRKHIENMDCQIICNMA